MAVRILVVDDEKMIRWSLRTRLEQAGYAVEEADTGGAAVEAATRETPDLALLDIRLPDRSGEEVLKSLRALDPDLPVVMMTAHASVEGAVAAIKQGAYDYLVKPFEISDLLLTVGRAIDASTLRREVSRQREQDRRECGVGNLVAESPAMKEVARMIRRVAQSEATTILLLGESGVGKGLVARALHYEGRAAERPFLNVTCTAIPETLLESELFGHERGAFTDARAQKKGLFELADGGTVFLDEIGDLSANLQAKLLRILEEKIFRRVGGTRDIQVSVRIVAATNKDLDADVEEGRFRRDLYYRLKVIPIRIPALRERTEDVDPLARRFLLHFNGEFKKNVTGFTPAGRDALARYPWPGNVRELRNAIERAVLLCDGEILDVADLPLEIQGGRPVAPRDGDGNGVAAFRLPAKGVVLEDVEKDFVRQALALTNGNRARAARLLGINRAQIRYRIEKFRLEVPSERDGAAESAPA
ncbi:MAG TPA: sigma-54 dependent transcriptional regulator [Planctomycetota bacterium]|jgi:DNA-binding NtrC family response regulator|nr:sigma-54 dependent transcriptional regulator [Planctomycetota bacterium]